MKKEKLYNYKAELIRTIDGDTIEVLMDLGFKTQQRRTIRLLGFNASETRTKDLEEKAIGNVQKLWLEAQLRTCSELYIHTEKKDSFGRYLGIAYNELDENINELFMEKFPETRV